MTVHHEAKLSYSIPWNSVRTVEMLSSLTDVHFSEQNAALEYSEPSLTLTESVSVLHTHGVILVRDWKSSFNNLILTDAVWFLCVLLVK